MQTKLCQNCQEEFPTKIKIEGVVHNLQSRNYCLNCSPFKKHNTKKINHLCDIDNKFCATCHSEKPIEDFYFKNKKSNLRQSRCKKCYDGYISKKWIDRKLKVIELMGNKCSRCGYCRNHSALEFHHLDPSIKEFDWSKMRLMSWNKILKEIDKCILVCANCHREIEYPKCEMAHLTGLEPAYSSYSVNVGLEDR